MKNTFAFMLLACCFLFGLTGCAEKGEDSEPIPVPERTNRTVLAYIVGDMNLWNRLEESINLMEKGWNDEIDGKLLVYLDNSNHITQFGQPVLLEITHDESDLIVSKVVKYYPDQDAGNPNVMQGVLNDAINLYPADSYGLIIGAHGNGWIPELTADSEMRGLSGSERYGSSLEIDALANILPLK